MITDMRKIGTYLLILSKIDDIHTQDSEIKYTKPNK